MIAALSGSLPTGMRVLVATRPVDVRRGADGLAATVQSILQQDPFSGTVFVFRSKRADRVKLLVYDGTGLVLIWKRLEGSTFKWPPVSDGVMRLSGAQLGALMRPPTEIPLLLTAIFRQRRRSRSPILGTRSMGGGSGC